VLCGLCLHLVAACDEGEESDVDINNVFSAYIRNYLTDSLKEGSAFNISRFTGQFLTRNVVEIISAARFR